MEFSNTKKISTKPPSCEASSHNAALQDEDQLDHAELWRSSVGRSLSAQPLVGFAVQQSSVKFAERSIVPAVAPWEGMETSVSSPLQRLICNEADGPRKELVCRLT